METQSMPLKEEALNWFNDLRESQGRPINTATTGPVGVLFPKISDEAFEKYHREFERSLNNQPKDPNAGDLILGMSDETLNWVLSVDI